MMAVLDKGRLEYRLTLLTLSLTLLGWGVQGQGNGRGVEVAGSTTVYLGQYSDIWRPLIRATVNLSDVSSIKSSFQIRTFDPEGVIFYGDTKGGEDWFVLSLKNGIPLMQLSQDHMDVSVAGGPKINDGKWHTLEVSNKEMFVILEVDGSSEVVVGMHSNRTQQAMSGELRLAVGGILIDKDRLMIQFKPHMDGCLREGKWLNLSVPWETAGDLWPCYENIQTGSYFPGSGYAIFNTSVLPQESNERIKIEVEGDFSQMDGTIFSIKGPWKVVSTLVANNDTKTVTFTFGEKKINMKNTLKRVVITFHGFLEVFQEHPKLTDLGITSMTNPEIFSIWKHGHLAIGSLLGEGEGNIGSQFLTGCLKKIQIQGQDLDFDLAIKQKSVTTHSCPA
ncbi:sex hormone-binding globulin isoform X2 [Cynoglossus semilaevis]|uniref:sex hormone-binding globulin isoform X2 n=1 Tax=Cynoglossus semilaevis TaxID=244447 RepID=UPI000D62BA9B|nr:sex hormone-binding globulin isoform X2 [Cynoglossus semilaevis]